MPPVSFDSILEIVGISFFSFLGPDELVSISTCDKTLYRETKRHIFDICMQQIPLNEDGDSSDTLHLYVGEEAMFPASKERFLADVAGLLQTNGVRIDAIEDDNQSDQLELLKRNSFAKLVCENGFTSHFALGFKHKSFKSRHLNRLHAKKFMDEGYCLTGTNERLIVKHWVYLLTSLDYISTGTWYAMFIHGQELPVGGAGMIFTHERTGETIEVVRRMSYEEEIKQPTVEDEIF